ncbi:hypothetical protein OsJ_31174 [Oryza sativa Japonica Group]|uniref:Uncharacterized protein n=1 Tax=Oryza sativa subsp. japonica TaxID=39947 RepID=B9G867_ORYSJ|nr:hypothetical protein OsJ_31174 [Oryza sativa Japonica Group]
MSPFDLSHKENKREMHPQGNKTSYQACPWCFFSNSNNLLFFSGTSDNPNTEDRQIRVPGWGGDGRRSEKKGEVTGIRGIVMGGSRPAVGGRIGKRRGASGGIRAAGMEEGVGTVLVRQGVARDEEAGGGRGILPPTAQGGRRGGGELARGPLLAPLIPFGQPARPCGGVWGKGVGGGGLAGVDQALVR